MGWDGMDGGICIHDAKVKPDEERKKGEKNGRMGRKRSRQEQKGTSNRSEQILFKYLHVTVLHRLGLTIVFNHKDQQEQIMFMFRPRHP